MASQCIFHAPEHNIVDMRSTVAILLPGALEGFFSLCCEVCKREKVGQEQGSHKASAAHKAALCH